MSNVQSYYITLGFPHFNSLDNLENFFSSSYFAMSRSDSDFMPQFLKQAANLDPRVRRDLFETVEDEDARGGWHVRRSGSGKGRSGE